MVIGYAVAAGTLSLGFSWVSEKIAATHLTGEPFSWRNAPNLKRLLWLIGGNLAAWLGCLWLHPDTPLAALLWCAGLNVLFWIAVEDGKTKQISNGYLFALLGLAVAATVADTATPWVLHLIGGMVGYVPLFLLRLLGEAAKKQEVLGAGDVYVSGILGLALGVQHFLLCGMVATLAALIAIRILRRKKQYDKAHTYPFSPFFLLGYIVAILCGSLLFGGVVIQF